MGQAVGGIFKALSCQDCAKYVCNSMDLKSKCCNCFEFELETNEVEIADDTSVYSIEVDGCCEAHSNK